jgi:predicted phosphodiesterase
MIWAILSDIHGRGDRLARVLADARARGADRFLALGDVGSTAVVDALLDVSAECVFGNWEASGLRGLARPYRNIVAHWPAQHRAPKLWAAHATPVWPAGLAIGGVVDYLRDRNLHWTALFPSLQRSEEARRAACLELESAAAPIFFHGHTHIQEAWRWRSADGPVQETGPTFSVADADSRFLIGVGSVGDARDGSGACYALYDDDAASVTWRRV